MPNNQHSRPSAAGLHRFAARGHHRLAYEFIPTDRGGAEAVVLLHGLLDGPAEWAVPRAGLAGTWTLVLPAARGHGASAALSNRDYTIAEAAVETLAVLDDAGLDATHLVGHGLGGAVAWEVARVAPQRVRSLSLVEPDMPALLDGALDPLAGSARRDDRQANRTAADAAYKGLVDQALDAYLSPRLGPEWRTWLPRPIQATYRRHAAALPPLLDALDNHAPVPSDLAPSIPLLVLYGSAGRPIVRLTAERIDSVSPNVHFDSLPTTAPTDQPLVGTAGDALTALLHSFIAIHTPPNPDHPRP